MTSEYEIAIRDLQQLSRRLEDLGVKPFNLVATLGELLVMRELEREGIEFKAVGGQASCDIVLTNGSKCVEVKTSTQKKVKKVHCYGWTVTRHRGKKQGEFDFLVCVGIKDIESALQDSEFYIFTGEDARKLEVVEAGWQDSTKTRLEICLTREDLDRWIARDGVQGWEKEVNETVLDPKTRGKYRNNWECLK